MSEIEKVMINKIEKRKSRFFEKHQQMDKPLVRLTRKKKKEREDSNVKLRNEKMKKGKSFLTCSKKKKIWKETGRLLETHKIPKLTGF